MSSLPRTDRTFGFTSPAPKVRLVHAFERPFENVVATARTCYSAKGIITEDQASARPDRRDALAKSIYAAGHHTTFQHAHVQFALENVSRQFLWTFLHSHPFYNSEQVSQRYVEVKGGNYAVPPMGPAERDLFEAAAIAQQNAYQRLRSPTPLAGERYSGSSGRTRGDGRRVRGRGPEAGAGASRGTSSRSRPSLTLLHGLGITLFRYWRLCDSSDAPTEQREVVGQMVEEVLRHDPLYEAVLQDPLPLEATPEFALFQSLRPAAASDGEFRREFDRELAGRVSRLVDWKANNEEILASSVREILGLARAALSDDEAIRLVLDPAKNRLLGETLTMTTHGKLSRALFHPSYTFRKKLSHTADSQDQRHRMTWPAARAAGHLSGSRTTSSRCSSPRCPEAATLPQDDGAHGRRSRRCAPAASPMSTRRTCSQRRRDPFTESADLLNLHQFAMRLCYNAQGRDLARVARRSPADPRGQSEDRPRLPPALHAAPPRRGPSRLSRGRPLLRRHRLEAGRPAVRPDLVGIRTSALSAFGRVWRPQGVARRRRARRRLGPAPSSARSRPRRRPSGSPAGGSSPGCGGRRSRSRPET